MNSFGESINCSKSKGLFLMPSLKIEFRFPSKAIFNSLIYNSFNIFSIFSFIIPVTVSLSNKLLKNL